MCVCVLGTVSVPSRFEMNFVDRVGKDTTIPFFRVKVFNIIKYTSFESTLSEPKHNFSFQK